MLTSKDYCDYETQKSLMNIGFPMKAQSYDLGKDVKEYLPKIHLYDAQKWLREEKKIHIEVSYQPATWTCKIYNLKTYEYVKGYTFFVSYEEALAEGIKEAVKILKDGLDSKR